MDCSGKSPIPSCGLTKDPCRNTCCPPTSRCSPGRSAERHFRSRWPHRVAHLVAMSDRRPDVAGIVQPILIQPHTYPSQVSLVPICLGLDPFRQLTLRPLQVLDVLAHGLGVAIINPRVPDWVHRNHRLVAAKLTTAQARQPKYRPDSNHKANAAQHPLPHDPQFMGCCNPCQASSIKLHLCA